MTSGALRLSRWLVLAIVPVVLIAGAFAQSSSTGALTGAVTDPSGAAVPRTTVTLTNNATNQARTVTTGTDGLYRFGLLEPGNYRVRFSAAGFKTAESPSVIISVTEIPVLD